jgi:hypothetical protein
MGDTTVPGPAPDQPDPDQTQRVDVDTRKAADRWMSRWPGDTPGDPADPDRPDGVR